MNRARRKILVLVDYYLPGFKGGGPIQTVNNLVEVLGDEFDFKVICRDRDLGDSAPYSEISHGEWNVQGKAQVLYLKKGFQGLWELSSILSKKEFDIVQLNSFFSFQFSIFPLALLKLFWASGRVLIGPRGEFSPGALSLKRRKKSWFIFFAKFVGLHRGLRWLASTTDEAKDIREIFPRADVAVAKDLALVPNEQSFRCRRPDDALQVIFVSRISPKKNLDYALMVLQRVKSKVHFTIYGPIEDEAYWSSCQKEIQKLPANITIEYGGALTPTLVAGSFAASDVFLFPTRGENFGHVIAEALYSGVPVIISDQTPWRSLQDLGVGWDIPLGRIDYFVERVEYCASLHTDDYMRWRGAIRKWAVGNIANKLTIDDNRKLFES